MSDDLAEIRERYRTCGRSSDIHVNLEGYIRSANDVPRLLVAAEAALKLADEWDAKAREIGAQITYQDTEGAVAAFKMIGVTRYQEDAKALRATIAAALTGGEAGDG